MARGARSGGGGRQEVEGQVQHHTVSRWEETGAQGPATPFVSVPAQRPTANTTAETNTALIGSWNSWVTNCFPWKSTRAQGRALSN